MLHQRIDVLDSNDYFLNCTDKLDRHEAVFAKIPIIDAAFQKVSNQKLPRVHRWKRPFINVTKQALLNDCMFFIWKYMEYYDGEKLTKEINPVSFISTTFFICFYFCIFFQLVLLPDMCINLFKFLCSFFVWSCCSRERFIGAS